MSRGNRAPRPVMPIRPGTMSFPREDLWTLVATGSQVLYGSAWRSVGRVDDCEKVGHRGCAVVTLAGIPTPQHVRMSVEVWQRHPVAPIASAR